MVEYKKVSIKEALLLNTNSTVSIDAYVGPPLGFFTHNEGDKNDVLEFILQEPREGRDPILVTYLYRHQLKDPKDIKGIEEVLEFCRTKDLPLKVKGRVSPHNNLYGRLQVHSIKHGTYLYELKIH